jgi:MscS family membrane protein
LRTWQSQAGRAGCTSRRGLLFFTSAAFEAGLCLPFPSQKLYLGRDEGLSAERAREVAEEVQRWRDSREIFLPSFPAERIAATENTLPYPAEGSPEHRAIASRNHGMTD